MSVIRLRANEQILIQVKDLELFYSGKQALFNISMDIPKNKVTALIGPSGCGKSTLLRCFNRMNDLVNGVSYRGQVLLDQEDINRKECDVIGLRRKVGMVFQRSNPFPMSVFDNVVYGLRIGGVRDKKLLQESAERSLKAAALWEEVKDKLNTNALNLSGGQMQRLCVARAIAINPEVLLMDEPCSALDPIATARIESLIHDLKDRFTVVLVTHNMQQASRVADYTAFLYMGSLVELNDTQTLFTKPAESKTEAYITGRFG
jgi:phosphate transport system ATP-binding protein